MIQKSRQGSLFAAVLAFYLGLLAGPMVDTANAKDTAAPQTPRMKAPADRDVLKNFPRSVLFEWSDVDDQSGVYYFIEIQTFFPDREGGSGQWRSEEHGPLRNSEYSHVHPGDQLGRWRVWAKDGEDNVGRKSVWRSFSFDTSALANSPLANAAGATAAPPAVAPAPAATPSAATPALPAPEGVGARLQSFSAETVEVAPGPEAVGPNLAIDPLAGSRPSGLGLAGLNNQFTDRMTSRSDPNAIRSAEPLPSSRQSLQLADATSLIPELMGPRYLARAQNVAAAAVAGDTAAPGAVAAKSPADKTNLSAYPRRVKLEWSGVQDPSGVFYTVEVETFFPFEGGGGAWRSQFYRDVAETSVTHNHAGENTGRWRVWAVDGAGNVGESSGWREFKFTGGSGASADTGAMQTAYRQPTRPDLGRDLLPEDTASAKPRSYPAATAMAMSASPTDGAPATSGNVEDRGTVDGSLPVPTPISPSDGVIIDDDEPYLACVWTEVPGARYTYEKQTLDPLSGQWISESWDNLNTTNRTPSHEAPKRGRWRVKATKGSQSSAWSDWRNFSFHGEGKMFARPAANRPAEINPNAPMPTPAARPAYTPSSAPSAGARITPAPIAPGRIRTN